MIPAPGIAHLAAWNRHTGKEKRADEEAPIMALGGLRKRVRLYGKAVLRRSWEHERYGDPEVVEEFLNMDYLLPPEQAVLNALSGWLQGKSVLDVGVGAGRTTTPFATLAGRYLGIDYSEAMVEACRGRFVGNAGWEFRCHDARRVTELGRPWDFVQFSFNGIDHLGQPDRIRFFRDIRSMLEPGGYFSFSSHNLRALPSVYKLHMSKGSGFREKAYALAAWVLVRACNPPRWRLSGRPFAFINDGALGFAVRGYHGTLAEDLRQLEAAALTDSWLTYLCTT
jgi:SAM-dependent methyltransferase